MKELLIEMVGWVVGVLIVLYIIGLLAHLIGARVGGAVVLP